MNNSHPKIPTRRFYDQDSILANSIELIETFPPDIQHSLAKGMSMIAIKDYGADERIRDLRSLGADIILPLYKSKQKRRYYDRNTDFHNSINYFRLLNEEERHSIARKVIDIACHVEYYLQTCHDTRTSPLHQNVDGIRDTYVDEGAEQAKQYAQMLCNDLMEKVGIPQTNISFDENRIQGSFHRNNR